MLAFEPAQLLQQGFAELREGRPDRAQALGEQVLSADASCWQAHLLLAGAARSRRQLDTAATHLRRAIALQPNVAILHLNLGEALLAQDHLDEAVTAFHDALRLQPTMADAHVNLGIALLRQNRPAEAIAAMEQAVALQGSHVEAHYNLGRAYQASGQLAKAIQSYSRAVGLRPSFAEAHYNLGTALQALGNHRDAAASYRQAIRYRPNYPAALNNLGIALGHMQQNDLAAETLRKAIELNPDYAAACCNLGIALGEDGQIEQSIAVLRRALSLAPHSATNHSSLVLSLHYDPSATAADLRDELALWNQRHAMPLTATAVAPAPPADPDRRLRIGYVSADLRNHAVAWNLLPLFRHRDRSQYEVSCYSNTHVHDAVSDELRSLSEQWHVIASLSDDSAAALIREHQPDILVDLSLHTQGNRLQVLARRPAPIQATFAGYPGSTGLSAIDYRFSDPYLDPPGMFDELCTEKTLRLPHSFWCFDPDTAAPAVNTLPALNAGRVTFASLNALGKINTALLKLWAEILRAVPDSHLLLLAAEGRCRQRIRDVLRGESVEPERIEFVSPAPRLQYMAYFHRIDISLDPIPYGSHNSGLDSLWMGVPLVTLVGQTICGRSGFSHLSNLGLTGLAAATTRQYVAIATALAGDLPHLAAMRRELRPRMRASPLCDTRGYAAAVQAAYRTMWHAWCTRTAPSWH